MNTINRILIEKSGHDNGFENALIDDHGDVVLASARHELVLTIADGDIWSVTLSSMHSVSELKRSFPSVANTGTTFLLPKQPIELLSLFLARAASLAKSLPNHPVKTYQQQAQTEIQKLGILGNTEVERMVKQRIGQNTYRQSLMDYWGGACAVTGVNVPEVLRASHAKPWAECETDDERLDVYNGFLLTANLDALFDKFLISFDEDGKLLISECILPEQGKALGLYEELRLRWIDQKHLVYLHWHRKLV